MNKFRLIVGLLLPAGLVPVFARAGSVNVTVGFNAAAPGNAVSGSFSGMSIETGSLQATAGYPYSGTNTQIIALAKNMGLKNIRVGGGSVDDETSPGLGADGFTGVDDFFTFAQDAGVNVIYSLRLLKGSTTDDTTIAKHIASAAYSGQLSFFAIGNEPNWHSYHTYTGHLEDPLIVESTSGVPGTAYNPATDGYLADWKNFAAAITAAGAVPAAAFGGPDTGDENGATGTWVGGTKSWTQSFTDDKKAGHITEPMTAILQHNYPGAGTGGAAAWVSGTSYAKYATAEDPGDGNHVYQCIAAIASDTTQPHSDATHWTLTSVSSASAWVSGTSYALNNLVEDGGDSNRAYKCILAITSDTTAPHSDATHWALLGAAQAINAMMSSYWPGTLYTQLNSQIMSTVVADGWHWRMTEANDHTVTGAPNYDGTGSSDRFAAALWALDYLHWWAANSTLCLGVNFHNKSPNSTQLIYQDISGNWQAHPKAAAIQAFNQGGVGNVIPTTINFPGSSANVTAYCVGSGTNMYVTIINKSNQVTGDWTSAVATIAPSGFTATSASYVELAPSTSVNGGYDITSTGATLGGAAIANSGTWTPTWNPLTVTGGQVTVTVKSASAVVVHLSS